MVEAIKNFFTETVGPYWSVFFCSMIPIIELRGAIPMGAALGLRRNIKRFYIDVFARYEHGFGLEYVAQPNRVAATLSVGYNF